MLKTAAKRWSHRQRSRYRLIKKQATMKINWAGARMIPDHHLIGILQYWSRPSSSGVTNPPDENWSIFSNEKVEPFWKWPDEGFSENQPMHKCHNGQTASHKRGSKRHRPAWAHRKNKILFMFLCWTPGPKDCHDKVGIEISNRLQRPWTTAKIEGYLKFLDLGNLRTNHYYLQCLLFLAVEAKLLPSKIGQNTQKFLRDKTLDYAFFIVFTVT